MKLPVRITGWFTACTLYRSWKLLPVSRLPQIPGCLDRYKAGFPVGQSRLDPVVCSVVLGLRSIQHRGGVGDPRRGAIDWRIAAAAADADVLAASVSSIGPRWTASWRIFVMRDDHAWLRDGESCVLFSKKDCETDGKDKQNAISTKA